MQKTQRGNLLPHKHSGEQMSNENTNLISLEEKCIGSPIAWISNC